MKKILLSFVGLLALCASAQHVTVVEKHRLLQGVEGAAFNPVLSGDGSRLLFSTGKDASLKLYDFKLNTVTRISNEAGSGIDARFAPNGNVYYVAQRRDSASHLIYRTGMRYDVAQARNSVVLEAQHGAVLPQLGSNGVALNGPLKSYRSSANIGNSVFAQGSTLILTVNGKTRKLRPVDCYAGYLWASLSPDGSKIAFVAAGKGVIVCDLNGKVLARLGRYQMPCWYDNSYIVAQNATDDGHQFTSSQIVLLPADGSPLTALTTPASMTMQPTTAAGRIVYTTIDGNLFEMKIKIDNQQ